MNQRSGNIPAWVPEGQTPFASLEIPGVMGAATACTPNPPLRKKADDAKQLASGVLDGHRGDLARAITLVESNAPGHRPLAREILTLISRKEQPAPAQRIGISGVPGAGKSTFIEAFGNFLCDAGHRLAVLTVDPSSTISGGSILGDKTRMELLSRREECFIRPSPSSGVLGGVTRKTRETILLCEAAGYDTILVETVGVGQSEIEVRSMVDCFVLLMIAGAGDDLQGMKKGILEIADILAVNKADGPNEIRALNTRMELERAVAFLSPCTEGWTPPVLAISARTGKGMQEMSDALEQFRTHVRTHGQFTSRRKLQDLSWWQSLVEQELRARFFADPAVARKAEWLEARISQGSLTPSVAAEELLGMLGSHSSKSL
ncbi:MAG: methylmalonyl Co-A mutase-associated GTPase MeaB [Terrimicrobiaceae bacterium]